jgi:hypothetical protein
MRWKLLACAEYRQQVSPFASGYRRGYPLPYRSIDFAQVALRALCDFGRNVLIKSF